MSWDRQIARRRVLQGAGAALSIPFLPSLMPTARAAEGAPRPRRFVALFSPNGQQRSTYWPSGEPDWAVVDAAAEVREVRLSQLPVPAISTVIGPELSAYRDKLLLIRGLDFVPFDAYGHYPTAMLSGWSRFGQHHVTLDQVLAASKAFYASPPRFPVINAVVPDAVPGGDPISVAEVAGVPSMVRGGHNPAQLFRTVFEDDSPSATEPEASRPLRLLVLDRVRAQYETLRGSKRIGSEDRRRLEAHVTFVHDLQRRLSLPRIDAGQCAAGQAPEELLAEEVNLPQLVDDTWTCSRPSSSAGSRAWPRFSSAREPRRARFRSRTRAPSPSGTTR